MDVRSADSGQCDVLIADGVIVDQVDCGFVQREAIVIGIVNADIDRDGD